MLKAPPASSVARKRNFSASRVIDFNVRASMARSSANHISITRDTAMAFNTQQTPFVKQLAANDRPTRDAALFSLRTYLRGHRNLTLLDLLKLWKGLFYSMWMCDRPRPQAQLASDLASLPTLLPPASRIPFQRAFWLTMAREWTNIDVLRMEKFLLLTRRYVGAAFEDCKGGEWKEDIVEAQMSLFEEIALEATDMRLPNGMRYHVIDVYVDELDRAGALGDGRTRVELNRLLEPLRKLCKDSPTKGVRVKCHEALNDERLPGNEKMEDRADDEKEKWDGIDT